MGIFIYVASLIDLCLTMLVALPEALEYNSLVLVFIAYCGPISYCLVRMSLVIGLVQLCRWNPPGRLALTFCAFAHAMLLAVWGVTLAAMLGIVG